MLSAWRFLLSLGVLAGGIWLAWPKADVRDEFLRALGALQWSTLWPYVVTYLVLLALAHGLRAWRWNRLLAPLGIPLPIGKLFTVSSIGFMATLVLPARLGELVRPALLRQRGTVSAASVLGTVAVERIFDGLIVSAMVFGGAHLIQRESLPPWAMSVAYATLGLFVGAGMLLLFAMTWPHHISTWVLRVTQLRRIHVPAAQIVEETLQNLIRGFAALRSGQHGIYFLLWTLCFWLVNGLSMWVLAKGMGLPLPLGGAFTTMGLIAVGLIIPNAPGLVGQFHWLTVLGLSWYLPDAVARSSGLAYATVLHGLQLVWFVGTGLLALAVWYFPNRPMAAKRSTTSPL